MRIFNSIKNKPNLINIWRTLPVEVWFHNGARKNPPFGLTYRPHFIVKGTTDYLGIQFENLEKKTLGEHIITRVQLTYESIGVDYAGLKQSVEFEIKEGGTTVGQGVVLGNKSTIAVYSQWEMECCGDLFSIGDVVEWQVEKGWKGQENLFVDGLIEYCYSAHASIDEKVFDLKATVLNIYEIWYEYKAEVINKQKVLVPYSGTAIQTNNTDWIVEKVPAAWIINLDLISVESK